MSDTYDAIAALRFLPHPPPNLTRGAKGWAVRLLHRLLAAHCYAEPAWRDSSAEVPDAYDDYTNACVRNFQAKLALENDGACGSDTWAWLGCRDVHSWGEVALVYARAEAYAGAREIGGNNRGPWVKKYCGGEGTQYEWCAGFATWCVQQAYKRLSLPTPDFGTNRLSSSALVAHALKHGRLISPATCSTVSSGVRVWRDALHTPHPGDLCIVRGGPTHYRHTTLLDRVEGERVHVMEGNVGPLSYVLSLVGVKTGIARPGSYPVSKVVFVRTA